MSALEKAELYLRENKIFPLANKNGQEIWGIEGKTGIWVVSFEKDKRLYKCNCKNVRNMDCSHIIGVKIKRNDFKI